MACLDDSLVLDADERKQGNSAYITGFPTHYKMGKVQFLEYLPFLKSAYRYYHSISLTRAVQKQLDLIERKI